MILIILVMRIEEIYNNNCIEYIKDAKKSNVHENIDTGIVLLLCFLSQAE